MTDMFHNTPVLSNANKGLIHKTFSSNPNWTYDWAVYANSAPVDLNASAPLVIMENESIGRVVGILVGSDSDANSTLRYSIPDSNESNATASFTMEENGTLLKVHECSIMKPIHPPLMSWSGYPTNTTRPSIRISPSAFPIKTKSLTI